MVRMILSRTSGDLLAGLWQLIGSLGAVPRRMIWVNETGNGRQNSYAAEVEACAGVLAHGLSRSTPRSGEQGRSGASQPVPGDFLHARQGFRLSRGLQQPAWPGAAEGQRPVGPADQCSPVGPSRCRQSGHAGAATRSAPKGLLRGDGTQRLLRPRAGDRPVRETAPDLTFDNHRAPLARPRRPCSPSPPSNRTRSTKLEALSHILSKCQVRSVGGPNMQLRSAVGGDVTLSAPDRRYRLMLAISPRK